MSQTGFNPLYRRPKRNTYSVQQCVQGVALGDRNALSYAITLAENQNEEERDKAYKIIALLADRQPTKDTKRITITGAPGAGKSTFIEHFGRYLIEKGHRLAVLAVDPSSQISQGSIMGDKTRMEALSTDPRAFIRPSSAGKMLGGVNQGTKEAIFLCERAGFDWILVETVGVGQSESLASSITDMTVLLVQPGAGDDIQGIKRGILEMTDLMVVNKADGPQADLAQNTRRSYASALQLFQNRWEGFQAQVLTASALEETGFEQIYQHIVQFFHMIMMDDRLPVLRKKQEEMWFDQMIRERALEWLISHSRLSDDLVKIKQRIREEGLSAFVALDNAMKGLKSSAS